MPDDTLPHYRQARQALAQIGYFRRGTLLRRFMPCGKSGCRCQATPPQLHGPYYEWTRKVAGKTVSLRLTPEQAALMAQWIAAGRQLDRLLARLERLSLHATDHVLRELRRQAPRPSARRRACRSAPARPSQKL